MTSKTRIEADFLGEKEIDDKAYYLSLIHI